MQTYQGLLPGTSIWNTITPTPVALTLPFYITEAGHFYTSNEYSIQRKEHDSFLLLYTLKGSGSIYSTNTLIQLEPRQAVIIDCHKYHSYQSDGNEWEFMWMHIHGNGVQALFHTLYPKEPNKIQIINPYEFEKQITGLLYMMKKSDIINLIEISLIIHGLINLLLQYNLQSEKDSPKKEHIDDIQKIISFIEYNYASPISLDDMIENVHISKYHFIRIFRRVMGVTPYNYLTNYRINMSKALLRTTNKTVEEIAIQSGFLDASNFIIQFKKHTGQKPLQYRKDFTL